jgi:hypothetical protein
LGIIAALGALIAELIVFIIFSEFINNSSMNISFSDLFIIPNFIIIAVCIEEIFKYLIISKRITPLKTGGLSYMINSFLVGFGFFATEISIATMDGNIPPIKTLGEIGIIHIGTAGIIAYILKTRIFTKSLTSLFAISFVILLHSTYNIIVSSDSGEKSNYFILILLALIILINATGIVHTNKKLA